MNRPTAADILLIKAAGRGDLHCRISRGYDDGKPEGWPVLVLGDEPVSDVDEGRLSDLERAGYLTWDEPGQVVLTDEGRKVAAR
jgi:hypothetical protein